MDLILIWKMFIGRMQIKQLCYTRTDTHTQARRQRGGGLRNKVIAFFADMNFLNNNAVFNKKLLVHSTEERKIPC